MTTKRALLCIVSIGRLISYHRVIAILIVSLFVFPQTLSAYDQAMPEPITIGAILPLSGEGKPYGMPLKQIMEYARTDINKHGGIKGHRLKIIYKDGICSPKGASNAAQKLIKKDKVKIIIGGVCSSETLAASPITEAKKVILLSPSSSAPAISTAGDFVFRTVPSDASQGEVLAAYALSKGFKKVGIIYLNNQFTQIIRDVFVKHFTEGGGMVLSEIYEETSNFSAIIEKLRTSDVDAYFIDTLFTQHALGILEELKKQDIHGPLLGNEAVMSFGSSDDFKGHMDYLEAMVGPQLDFNENDPRFLKFAAFYKKRYRKDLIKSFLPYIARTYDAIFLVKEALESTGHPVNTEAIRDYLYGIKNRRGIAGFLTFDKNGDPTSGYVLKIIKNGKGENLFSL